MDQFKVEVIGANRNQVSLEDFKSAWDSHGWKSLSKRLQQMLLDQQRICETSPIQTEVLRAQGQVAALRRALELPDIMLKEMQAKGIK